jgi:uncharacterized membrane protein
VSSAIEGFACLRVTDIYHKIKFPRASDNNMPFLLTFLLGFVNGLRSLTPPALVCWAAHLGWLHFAGTRFAFVDHPATLIIFTLLAIAELIADKLPNTPARTAPLGLSARIFFGGACGLALATSAGISLPLSALLAAIGAVVGAFAGYHTRHFVVAKLHVPDLVAALAEDLITIGSGLLILYCTAQ